MDIYRREPYTEPKNPYEPLDDPTINEFKSKLSALKKIDLNIDKNFQPLEAILNKEQYEKIKLIKLLYCLNYKREIFLYFGIIIESMINEIIDLYITNNWNLLNYTGSNKLRELNKEKNSPLSSKATFIESYNLFNNNDASRDIEHSINQISIFRNYGGHAKENNFLENCVRSMALSDAEILQCINIISKINIYKNLLIQKPP